MILGKQDLAFVTNKLQVPLIIGDILNDRASLNAEVEFGLHEVLSEFQPDSALLAIALSAKAIITSVKQTSPSFKVLELECNRILQDYGSIWASNAKHERVDIDQIFDVLVHTTDDLEAISELLETNLGFLRQIDETTAQLCQILQIQAKAQAMVADAFMSAAESHAHDTEETFSPELTGAAFSTAAFTDNVVPFPITDSVH